MNVDLILTNGNVCTLEKGFPDVQAVAIRDGRIVAVGTSDQIETHYSAGLSLDLHGAFVLPGLTDGHGHVTELGMSLTTIDLRKAESAHDVATQVREEASKSPPGCWIKGRDWDQEKWKEKTFPTHEILDGAAQSDFVYLVRVDGHAVWVNQKVMDFVGVTRYTGDPKGGRIVRDSRGNPTGIFIDAAINLIASKIPAPTNGEIEDAIQLALDTCARYGLTEIHDAGIDYQTVQAYRKLAAEGKLKLRIYAMYLGTDSTLPLILREGPVIGYKEYFTMRSIKVYMDGALGSRGAALVQQYTDDAGNYGLTEMGEKDLENLTIASLSNGFQVCTHAIGDRANDIVLNSYEAAFKAVGSSDPRLRIEHAQVLLKEDISRFRKLGVIPSMQPTHCTSDMSWAEMRLGPERIKYAYAWHSLLHDGNIIIGGSDFPVESPDPRLGIYAAVTRRDLFGLPRNFDDVKEYFQVTPDVSIDSSDFAGGFFPQEKMSISEALEAFTSWPAYGAFQENERGTISPGKFADLTIFKEDMRKIPSNEIPSDEILGTMVDGRFVYSNPALYNSGSLP